MNTTNNLKINIMKVKKGIICNMKSSIEAEVHVGSGFCKRCEFFNGICSTDKMCISCLNFK